MKIKQWIAYGLVIVEFVIFSQPVSAVTLSSYLVRDQLNRAAVSMTNNLKHNRSEVEAAKSVLRERYLGQHSDRSPFTADDFQGVNQYNPAVASLVAEVLNDMDEAIRNQESLNPERSKQQASQLLDLISNDETLANAITDPGEISYGVVVDVSKLCSNIPAIIAGIGVTAAYIAAVAQHCHIRVGNPVEPVNAPDLATRVAGTVLAPIAGYNDAISGKLAVNSATRRALDLSAIIVFGTAFTHTGKEDFPQVEGVKEGIGTGETASNPPKLKRVEGTGGKSPKGDRPPTDNTLGIVLLSVSAILAAVIAVVRAVNKGSTANK